MRVLGISGSPIADSNVDRAVKHVLSATGLETEFIKLAGLAVEPCRACLGCVKTNQCVIQDDGRMLAEKAREADALVVGGFTPYSTIDGRTKAFLERMYCLRHIKGYMAGKPGGAVVTCAIPPECETMPPACEMGSNAVMFYMMEEGMNYLGAVQVYGTLPCITCGYGDACKMSGVKMIHGEDATVDTVGFSRFEDQAPVVEQARALGKSIAEALSSSSSAAGAE